MSKSVRIRRGANIKLVGVADKSVEATTTPSSFAIKPTDFHALVPKMMLKEGAEVSAGTPIFHDKKNEHIKFVSPVNGEVAEIVRGAKRKILEIRIIADSNQELKAQSIPSLADMDRATLLTTLMESGFWPMVKQRPYDVVADPTRKPKAIFISTYDSAPLGADMAYLLGGEESNFQTGIDAMAKLTDGKVHVGVNQKDPGFFANVKNAQVNQFNGPHPAGNVGIQIHHIDPVNKGDVVWTVSAQGIAMIGRYLNTGKADFSKKIALVGSEVNAPKYLTTITGAAIKSITEGRIKDGDVRVISGNVLTGTKLTEDGYLGYYDHMVSVIPEGREPQFMGWLAPNFHKFSLSHAYFSWLMPNKRYELNTNANGEDRAYVMSGQYDKVLPMDIYPVQLIKSIMTNDIEKMEALGIYEVAPEDLALCEYACTSKMEVQQLIRKGLDTAMEELG